MIEEEQLKEKDNRLEKVVEVEFKLIENVVEDLGDVSGEAHCGQVCSYISEG